MSKSAEFGKNTQRILEVNKIAINSSIFTWKEKRHNVNRHY
jgi:hypothetical protein